MVIETPWNAQRMTPSRQPGRTAPGDRQEAVSGHIALQIVPSGHAMHTAHRLDKPHAVSILFLPGDKRRAT